MKHIAKINIERLDCRVQPVLHPYMTSVSTTWRVLVKSKQIVYPMDNKCKWICKIGQPAWIFQSWCTKNFCNINFEN